MQFTMKMSMGRMKCADEWNIRHALSGGQAPRRNSQWRWVWAGKNALMSEMYALSGGQAPRRNSQWRWVWAEWNALMSEIYGTHWAEGRHPDAIHNEDEYGQNEMRWWVKYTVRTERRAGTQTQLTMKMSMGRMKCADEWNIRYALSGGQAPRRNSQWRWVWAEWNALMSEIYALSGGQAPRCSSQWGWAWALGRMKCADEWKIRTERRVGTQTQFTMKMGMGRKNALTSEI